MVTVDGCDGGNIGVGTGSNDGHVVFASGKSYNGKLFSVSLAGWPCRVSQTL
jgi:hypothetical protein